MRDFVYQGQPARVVFGAGALGHLAREVDALGAARALVVCTPGQVDLAERATAQLGERLAGLCPQAVMHVPLAAAEQARAQARQLRCDAVVALGGGSATGLAKAIALATGLPIVAVPTTYAGSEVTSIYGWTEAGVKRTGRDPRVLPRTVLYDPQLTLSLPWRLSVTSGFNAIAHAAEALYAEDGNPIAALMAEEGLRASAAALAALQRDPQDLAARADALYGAWLCGTVLGAVAMGLHHKLCHTLGGTVNLPHADVHCVVLPHALAYNAAQAPQAMQRIARALGAEPVPGALFDLARGLGAPVALKDLGMPASALDAVADLAVRQPYPNPRPLERAAIRELLQRAFDGVRPD